MTELLGQWIIGLAGAALFSAAAMALTPKGRVRDVTRLVCGVVTALALISPVKQLDMSLYSMNLAQYRQELEKKTEAVTQAGNRLSRAIIQEECCAYILDKAQVLGMDVGNVSVTVKWGDEQELWYPYEVSLEGAADSAGRQALARTIEAELGIPEERQVWIENGH